MELTISISKCYNLKCERMSLTEAKHVVRGTKEGVYLCVVPYFACITLTTTVRKIIKPIKAKYWIRKKKITFENNHNWILRKCTKPFLMTFKKSNYKTVKDAK